MHLGCCPFYGGGFGVGDLLFYVPPIVGDLCWSFLVFIALCPFWFYSRLGEKELTSCFAFVDFRVSCCCG